MATECTPTGYMQVGMDLFKGSLFVHMWFISKHHFLHNAATSRDNLFCPPTPFTSTQSVQCIKIVLSGHILLIHNRLSRSRRYSNHRAKCTAQCVHNWPKHHFNLGRSTGSFGMIVSVMKCYYTAPLASKHRVILFINYPAERVEQINWSMSCKKHDKSVWNSNSCMFPAKETSTAATRYGKVG